MNEKRIILAKRVASRYLEDRVRPEYRMTIMGSSQRFPHLFSILKSFRDGNWKIASVSQISDLGLKNKFDGVEVWSADRNGLLQLQDWAERVGMETTGVW